MRPRPGRLVRLLVFVLCVLNAGLGVAACLGTHRSSEADAHFCGTPSVGAMSTLAETAPDVFADAWRDLTGSDAGCCLGCPGCGPAAGGAYGAAFVPSPAAVHRSAVTLSLGACRHGPRKPPSTAPPLDA